jgi:hypothetical protein
MPKINSSSVKICESSQKVLKKFSKSSQKVLAQKFSIVTRAIVNRKKSTVHTFCPCLKNWNPMFNNMVTTTSFYIKEFKRKMAGGGSYPPVLLLSEERGRRESTTNDVWCFFSWCINHLPNALPTNPFPSPSEDYYSSDEDSAA